MVQQRIRGSNAAQIAASIEASIRDGALAPGAPLPTVRALAADLGVSPTTVAAAFRTLRSRGLLLTRGRRGTRVSPRPPLALPAGPEALPAGVRDLATGNPDPALLPDLSQVLAEIDATPVLYGQSPADPELLRLAARRLGAQGLPTDALAIVGGALDGMERALATQLRPGDRVAVEDPGFTSVFDLLAALGLEAVPVAVDDAGLRPDALAAALSRGIAGLIVTPRAQNPSGAALDPQRARELRKLLRDEPELLLIEDDHGGEVCGAEAVTLVDARRPRWVHLRSVSKALGPDLRLAVMAGDAASVARVDGRQQIGSRWVSHLLQRCVAALWRDRSVAASLRRAARTYTERRQGLLSALERHGVAARGRSGFNVWIPVPAEAPLLRALLDAGFAVAAGERFRLESPAAIRVTTASLQPEEAEAVARTVSEALRPRRRSAPA